MEKRLEAKTISEIGGKDGYLDILFQLDSYPFILEIKLGKEEKKLTRAIAQVVDYGLHYNTRNVIVLQFPFIESGQVVLDIENFKNQIVLQKVRGWVHTDYLDKWIEEQKFEEVFEELKSAFKEKVRKIDFNSVIKAIREIVQDLYEVIKQARTDEIFEEVAQKLELFVGLGEIEDKNKAINQVSMLASYLLFNQLLFYHIYKMKTNSHIPELKPVKSISELQEYFSQITNIDYQPIYAVNLVDKIVDRPEIIELINECIKNLLVIRAEHITQDLAGRFFHSLLPKEVAKVWAAFYTNPVAAEILARLAINEWNETILDPACGSGTLLSAAYRRKLNLAEINGVALSKAELHKKFVEEDITGIDIMPFACHLTAINLALQRLEQTTDLVRVARMDSLDLAAKLKFTEFRNKGILIEPFHETIQLTLDGEKRSIKKLGTVSPAGKGRAFYLKPVNVVIMNPPFSDRDKLPNDYVEKLKKNELGQKCGHQVNLWGYFLSLADLILEKNGRIAAVVPINLARGGATEKIRKFIIENYHIKYIVKPVVDLAFSESADFRDILLIAEKRKPKERDITKIIFLKKSIKEIEDSELQQITNFNRNYVDLKEVTYNDILTNKDNLMPLLASEYIENAFEKLNQSPVLTEFNSSLIEIGLPYRPLGLADGVFITNTSEKSRIERAFSIVSNIDQNEIKIGIKNVSQKISHFKLKKDQVLPALRTNTGIKRIQISQNEVDFILARKNEEYLLSLKRLNPKIPLPFPWNEHLEKNIIKKGFYLVIPRKIRLNSPNTYVISVFSEEKLYSAGPSLWCFISDKYTEDDLKILNLYFNSILTIIQILLYKSETLGAAYFELMKSDWNLFKVIDVNKLKKEDRETLLNLYKKISHIEFPSIIEQLKERFWARIELDKTLLKILGFSDEFEGSLPQIYDAVVEELTQV
ncbi:MAG: N-6 DNA methylase [Nitrososphaeria archaeon]